MARNQNRYIVGIDFGAMVSYTHCTANRDPTLWQPHGATWNIPSVIDYDGRGRLIWGEPAKQRPNPLYGNLGARSVADVVGDFLGALRDGVMAELEAYARDVQVDWCLAVPTCWTIKGREVFRTAVKRAGLQAAGHRVIYISEAKAAATWAGRQLQGNNRGIHPGETVIDVATLVVDQNGQFLPQPQQGRTSERCGGLDIDSLLLLDFNLNNMTPAAAADVRMAVDQAKRLFTGNGDVSIPSGLRTGRRGRRPSHRFAAQALHAAYDPVVETIVGMVSDQIRRAGGGDHETDPPGRLVADILWFDPQTSIGAVSAGAALHARAHGPPRAYDSAWSYGISLPEVKWGVNGVDTPDNFLPAIHPGRLTALNGVLDGTLSFRPGHEQPVIAIYARRPVPPNPDENVLQDHDKAGDSQHDPQATYDLPNRQQVHQRAVRIEWRIRDEGDVTMTWEVYHREGEQMPQPQEPLAVLGHSVAEGIFPVW
ncbi:hypothetical protein BO78DRAFT_424607 [Aspergillus sclerotiicarbonarius CBS 121057]|uniref:Actin-like ATPase domain-containing protein n=1 Tax=Aspergillus sclerotiicarbonarius (strain CBS 121057 / IBT 28362) TaxID=1448318 RepID=A0A319DRP1_ASPSB|nr:hypothetical protein BO78DRAFT_424607 [Aspergillus sclerotiicarbonarius CBS 121057]